MRVKLLFSFVFSVICICINSSCSKTPLTPTQPIQPTDTTPSNPVNISAFDIYIAGDTMISGTPYAAYWKNGKISVIPSGPNSFATSIYVYNNDVYVAVQGTIADTFQYWKNGVGVVLRDTLGFSNVATALTFSGGNLYTTGTQHEYPDLNYGALYWKNNEYAVHLVPHISPVDHSSWGKAITVSNQDVYIAGYIDNNAVYWKNQNIAQLPVDSAFINNYSIANSVFFSNGNLYVAGTMNLPPRYSIYDNSVAVYWKNSIPIKLTTVDTGSSANAIAVSGSDIYVAGELYNTNGTSSACFWKNGKLSVLDSNYSITNAIGIHGQDVYVVGNIGYDDGTCWKNGIPNTLSNTQANAIFIADK